MRKGDWKLVQPLINPDQIRVYNLKRDLAETKDLAISRPAKLAELLKEMTEWRKSNQVPLPPASPLAH